MQCPTGVDLKQLKHIGRCVVGQPRVALAFVDQAENKNPAVIVLADTDYAGCPITRRSTHRVRRRESAYRLGDYADDPGDVERRG